MARFLFTSVPVEGHSSSPLSIMARLVDDGHDVVWLAGARYAARARHVGVQHVPVWVSTDFSVYDDLFDVHPELRDLRGTKLLEVAFREVFLGERSRPGHRDRAAARLLWRRRARQCRTTVRTAAGRRAQAGQAGADRRRPILDAQRHHGTVRTGTAAAAGRARPGTKRTAQSGRVLEIRQRPQAVGRDPRRSRSRTLLRLGVRLDGHRRPRSAGLRSRLRVRPAVAGGGALRRRPSSAGASGVGSA